ncbi:YcxB family protein [Natranaerofaba carboxydovora]|uniref:YcxB family protein n=1 Tax=Natranaerofaba carboxydovora TaxID=2742683 RepID=UPI001F131BAE|nr:YcxB family protein [Natranaerofaba carboxydovora]UMZ72571.1 YcxB-like protein [Natranaerofaba carboxydovora]
MKKHEVETELILEGNITTKEYIEFRYFNQRRLLLSVIAAFTLLIFVLYLLSTAGLFRSLMISISCMAVMYIAMRLLFLYVPKKELEKDKLLREKMQYVINKDGIIQKVKDKSRTDLTWKDLSFIKELSNSFVIYLPRKQAFLIPKSFFKSKQEEDIFREIVQRNLKIM